MRTTFGTILAAAMAVGGVGLANAASGAELDAKGVVVSADSTKLFPEK